MIAAQRGLLNILTYSIVWYIAYFYVSMVVWDWEENIVTYLCSIQEGGKCKVLLLYLLLFRFENRLYLWRVYVTEYERGFW